MDTRWHQDALCAGRGDDTFYPEQSDKAGSKAAQEFCTHCPVQEQCLAWAKENDEKWGIWGGKSRHARKQPRLYLGGGIG